MNNVLYLTNIPVPHPSFVQYTHLQALQIAFEQNKPLFIYLHSDLHEDGISFCESLCSEIVVEFLDTNFISWTGSVLSSEGFRLANYLSVPSYPYFCIVTSDSGRINNMKKICSNCKNISPSQIVEVLLSGLEKYRTSYSNNINSTILRTQQDIEYQALVQDRENEQKRLEEQKIEQQRIQEEQNIINHQLQEEQKRNKLKENLPPEPEKDDPNSILLCIRLPDGSKKQRRFRKNETFQILFDFINSHELYSWDGDTLITNYELVQLRPKQIFKSNSMTFEEANLSSRSLLYVQEIINKTEDG